ncbi:MULTISPECIES: SDR family NAD(P)-dependent oxidoreductase [Rhizobiaceae]|uniref:NAD(P)-dependent dehydrogenase (Short-subunit alcohol dehydrogenase family) n=1 Tax=Aliirhizobium cellulosilyticum TaxID=393664 RepID=A0A7W6Y0Z4_9HYPH|nr:SDR family oxidoreductase [Rhizobium cellulosilyticum]MBB4346982.1 NAD(P)-dependent dehydrogenase (short-subunit alcohol dehydrogenase family) [Rhizobium cellulosilyticum]MBB4410624.1 NAD(P)-dependent dehydrogenase (short-subunit alcohol dehydrogenase family) [Rhizobium cellulosilyticum]MBB4445312.1 NAD(P)-dependent dehydrogenase (short-subunit alcohol dehydrogenase family) [Rhizobium cellulosilyticum]
MKIVIVTGSSRGLGASTALKCAERGMGVIVTYNSNLAKADEVVGAITAKGGKAIALKLDVADSRSFEEFHDAVKASLETVWGRTTFDFLVNNAGYGLYAPFSQVTQEQFDGLFNVHLKGPFFLTQALLPLMEDGGHIINLTSATSRVATAGVSPYASFKGGLEVLTRYMAKELGERRIRANSVAPGAIRTELGGGLNDEFEAMLAAQTALGRVGEPEEIGGVIASLLSEESRWINAQNIEVAGGYII